MSQENVEIVRRLYADPRGLTAAANEDDGEHVEVGGFQVTVVEGVREYAVVVVSGDLEE
jgi:hypothetical protein